MKHAPQPESRPESHRPRSLCRTIRRLDARLDDTLGRLSPVRAALWMLGLSLAFAGAMIGASWFVDDPDTSQGITQTLLAVWWIPFSVLAYGASRNPRRAAGCSRGEDVR